MKNRVELEHFKVSSTTFKSDTDIIRLSMILFLLDFPK